MGQAVLGTRLHMDQKILAFGKVYAEAAVLQLMEAGCQCSFLLAQSALMAAVRQNGVQ